MMDGMFLVELVLELVVQVLFEAVVGLFGHVMGRVFSNRVVRVVLGAGTAVAAGYAGGYWWGHRLSEPGRVDEPHSLWVSLALAGVLFGVATVRRPGAGRWAVFGLLNIGVAAGIAVGFTPRPG